MALSLNTVQAEIFRLPVLETDLNRNFSERADAMRIPAEILADNAPLGEPTLAEPQNRRPAWAPAQDDVPIFQPTGRRVLIQPRGGDRMNLRMVPQGAERVWVITTPIQITVLDDTGPVELSADRVVVWTDENVMDIANLGLSHGLEFYMEGNIEFRQGGYRGLAERMYYNVGQQNGVILEGELFGEARQRSVDDLEDFRTPFRL